MRSDQIKQQAFFAFNGKATMYKITRTVGETVYYRNAKTPYYLYSNTSVHMTTKSELEARDYKIEVK